MSFNTVTEFESALAKFWNAPYAVATDCCTHAIELSLRYTASVCVTVPKYTYISVPMTCEKLGLDWSFVDLNWRDYYRIGNTRVIDSAVYWKPNGYISGSLQCLSFQFKKPLNLARGGAILTDSKRDYDSLKAMAYDGRDQNSGVYWGDQAISTMGYHYYMTPETAQLGIDRLPGSVDRAKKSWSWRDYPDCSRFPVFG